MKIKELFNRYNQQKDKLVYFAFIKKLKELIPDLGTGVKLSEIEFNEADIIRICKFLEIDLSVKTPVEEDVTDNGEELPVVIDEEEKKEQNINDFNSILGEEIKIETVIKYMNRANRADAQSLIAKINRLHESPNKVKKIMLPFIYTKHEMLFSILIKPYTYALLPNIWRKGNVYYNLITSRVIKYYRWEYKHAVVFNDTELLHIFL